MKRFQFKKTPTRKVSARVTTADRSKWKRQVGWFHKKIKRTKWF
jgi:hypothetical protein